MPRRATNNAGQVVPADRMAEEYYLKWVADGARTIPVFAREHNLSVGTVSDWSRRFEWRRRWNTERTKLTPIQNRLTTATILDDGMPEAAAYVVAVAQGEEAFDRGRFQASLALIDRGGFTPVRRAPEQEKPEHPGVMHDIPDVFALSDADLERLERGEMPVGAKLRKELDEG